MMSKLDFSKATYDEEAKTYKGLDEDIKGLTTTYGDLFERKGTQQIQPGSSKAASGSEFFEQYKKDHPELNLQ